MEKDQRNGGSILDNCPDTQQTPLSIGLQQYCNIFRKHKDLVTDGLRWGDETEYIIIGVNDDTKTANALPIAPAVLRRLWNKSAQNGPAVFTAMPESTDFQIETVPILPFSGRLEDLGLVEENMRMRREIMKRELPPDAHILTMTSFPRMGRSPSNEQLLNTPAFDNTMMSTVSGRCRVINKAFKERGGDEYRIHIPVYRDLNTTCSVRNLTVRSEALALSCNALQVTVETKDLSEARYLHDQLVVFCPVLIALTAGTSTLNGFLTKDDSRLVALSESLDDRTYDERYPTLDKDGNSTYRVPRCGQVRWYISEQGVPNNDLKHEYNMSIYHQIINAGVDKDMARHMAMLFTHPVYEEAQLPEKESTDLLERINKSVWPYVRLKPPSVDGTQGWRLEFRPMAIQPTDYENAAFAVFVLLLTRTLRQFSPNFTIPMSKVHENCKRAITRDAIQKKKFHFRLPNTCTSGRVNGITDLYSGSEKSNGVTEMTVNEIINGNSDFPGVIPLIKQYLDTELLEIKVKCKVEGYLQLVSEIASGERPTVAHRIREFVFKHPEYKRDSEISERIQYDLVKSYLSDSWAGNVQPPQVISDRLMSE